MNYYQLSQFVFYLFILLSLYFTIRKQYKNLLLLFVAGIGFSGLNIYYGTLWLPYKIVTVFILLIVIFNFPKRKYPKYFYVLLVLFLFTFFVGLLLQPPGDQSHLPVLQRSYLRPFVQLFTYVSLASLIPFTVMSIRNMKDLKIFLSRYYLVVELVMLFAVLQFVLQKSGIDFMPILRPNLTDSPTAAFNIESITIVRLYGVTGEPKTLSAFLFPYFFISLYSLFNKSYNRNYVYHLIMLTTSLFVIINAFSSAVLISLAVALVLFSIIWFRANFKIVIPIAILIILIQFINPFQFSVISTQADYPVSLYDLLFERTAGRLMYEGVERPDFLAIDYVVEERPQLIISGIGMGMYPYFITSSGSYGIDPINSTWVVFLMDVGLAGILIFSLILVRLFAERKKSIIKKDKFYNLFLLALFASYILGLGVSSYHYIMLFTGLTIASLRIVNLTHTTLYRQKNSQIK